MGERAQKKGPSNSNGYFQSDFKISACVLFSRQERAGRLNSAERLQKPRRGKGHAVECVRSPFLIDAIITLHIHSPSGYCTRVMYELFPVASTLTTLKRSS